MQPLSLEQVRQQDAPSVTPQSPQGHSWRLPRCCYGVSWLRCPVLRVMVSGQQSPRAADGRLSLGFLERARWTLDANIAKRAFKPSPPSLRLTQRSRAKELRQKSMPSALPFQPPPPCPCLLRQGRDSSSAFNILRADLPNIHPYPVARRGQARAGCYAEKSGPNTQRCQVIAQERVFGTHGRMLKCLRGHGGRAGAPLSRSVGAGLQGALRNRPTRPCPPPPHPNPSFLPQPRRVHLGSSGRFISGLGCLHAPGSTGLCSASLSWDPGPKASGRAAPPSLPPAFRPHCLLHRGVPWVGPGQRTQPAS